MLAKTGGLLALLLWVPSVVLAACNADNCLRAVRGQGSAGASFCEGLTASPVTEAAALSTFASPCQGQAARASSACSCFMATYAAASETASSDSTCHRNNCFRGLLRGEGAYDFCKTYTTAVVTQTTSLPTFVSHCSVMPSAMSSACSCVMSELEPSSTPTSVSSSSSSTSSSTSLSSTTISTPTCTPMPELDGVSEGGFNPAFTEFSITLSCGDWNSTNYAVFRQLPEDSDPFGALVETTSEGAAINVPGFDAGYVKLTVVGTDSNGSPILKQFSLLFGSIDMPVIVFDEEGNRVPDVEVVATSNAYFGIQETATTDASGVALFRHLSASVGLFVRTTDNKVGLGGVAATESQVSLSLIPLEPASNVTDFLDKNGTTGWVGGTILDPDTDTEPEPEPQPEPSNIPSLAKRAPEIRVSTNGQRTLQVARANPRVYPFTKTVFIKYKFQTDEVPGGYFGTEFNDFYRIIIRSDKNDITSESQSMNQMGLGAFDPSGSTDWLTLQMAVDPATSWVQFDVGVQNVADAQYQSQIIVGALGDLKCEECGSCETCPGNPICQDTCQKPPRGSCDFYTRCAEAALECGPQGYPIAYGAKYCQAFSNRLGAFSPEGQTWVWDVMHCLQSALVEPVGSCDASCSSIRTIAFDSHPGCYVDAGVCFLHPFDWAQIVWTVNSGLFAGGAGTQVLETLGKCATQYGVAVRQKIEDVIQELLDSIDDVLDAAFVYAKVMALRALLLYLERYLPPGPVTGS